MKKVFAFMLCGLLGACQSAQNEAVENPKPVVTPVAAENTLPVVGGVETLYVMPMKMPFHARMDTGAETSSLDVQNARPFERDGEKWVSFDVINRKNNEKYHFEKPLKRKTTIIRTGDKERRYVVHMDVKMGNEVINAEFTLNDRSRFDYQVLVGRNIINGRFVIDPSLENTMH
jgi:hypothetical protein